jgi:hypothetical protein
VLGRVDFVAGRGRKGATAGLAWLGGPAIGAAERAYSRAGPNRLSPLLLNSKSFSIYISFIPIKPRLLYAYKYIASTWLPQWGPQDVF